MKIKQWLFTSDTHGSLNDFYSIQRKIIAQGYNPTECAVIILGDAGFNYYLDHRDKNLKDWFSTKCDYTVYCIKGNHEARPTDIKTMEKHYDYDVCGPVYLEPHYPKIRYFLDTVGKCYKINGYSMLTIGGAYSVDKYYRLEHGWGWFDNEQLSQGEMDYITHKVTGNNFDFVLSHTCPLSWQPIDLFLSVIDQSKVDNTMEVWMDELKNKINYKTWLFGHYHDDRLVRPKVEMLYSDVIPLEYYVDHYINKTEEIPQYFNFDPRYEEDN